MGDGDGCIHIETFSLIAGITISLSLHSRWDGVAAELLQLGAQLDSFSPERYLKTYQTSPVNCVPIQCVPTEESMGSKLAAVAISTF